MIAGPVPAEVAAWRPSIRICARMVACTVREELFEDERVMGEAVATSFVMLAGWYAVAEGMQIPADHPDMIVFGNTLVGMRDALVGLGLLVPFAASAQDLADEGVKYVLADDPLVRGMVVWICVLCGRVDEHGWAFADDARVAYRDHRCEEE